MSIKQNCVQNMDQWKAICFQWTRKHRYREKEICCGNFVVFHVNWKPTQQYQCYWSTATDNRRGVQNFPYTQKRTLGQLTQLSTGHWSKTHTHTSMGDTHRERERRWCLFLQIIAYLLSFSLRQKFWAQAKRSKNTKRE